MKEVLIDTETTGLNHKKNGLYQVSGYIFINGKKKESFDIKMKPLATDVIDINGEKIKTSFVSNYYGYKKFISILSKYVDKYNPKDKFDLIAYNSKFDENFLREWFIRNGDNYFGSFFDKGSYCIMQKVKWSLKKHGIKLKNYKLSTVCEFYKIPFDDNKLHDSMYDVKLLTLLYKKII